MKNSIPTFDQLPQLVSDLVKRIDSLHASVASLMSPTDYSTNDNNQVANCYAHTLCDIKRACEITKKAKSTLYAIARRGEIPCLKKGKCWYFFEDELQEWIEQGRKHRSYYSNNDEQLIQIQKSIHHKPKSIKRMF